MSSTQTMRETKQSIIEYYERWGIETFKEHRIQCIHGAPQPGGIQIFECKNPETRNMMFQVSFLPTGIYLDGDMDLFVIHRKGLAWLLGCIQSRSYVLSKMPYVFQNARKFIPGEVDAWLEDQLEELRSEHDVNFQWMNPLSPSDNASEEAVKEWEALRALRDEWFEIMRWSISEEDMGRKWCAHYYDVNGDFEMMSSWYDSIDDVHQGYQALKAFVRLYHQTFL